VLPSQESTKKPVGPAQRELLVRAASAFEMGGQLKLAATCLANGGEYSLASTVREQLGMVS